MTTIQFAIYTCPPIPVAIPSPDTSSKDSGLWSPLCCTLIYTPTTAVIVDCPPSVAATKDLVAWASSKLPEGCVVRYFIPTHAHGDHFLGLPVLQEAFPSIAGVGTQLVVGGIAHQHSPEVYDGVWFAAFPPSDAGTGLPAAKAEFTALATNELHVDGHAVRLHDVPHGDTHASSFVHVPDLDLVVAGDIVYNGDCHQFLGEAGTAEKREQWNQALAQIEALQPKVVVPGHTFAPASEPDLQAARAMLESTRSYIRGFEEELAKAKSQEALFESMKVRFPRWNLWILSVGCQRAMEARA